MENATWKLLLAEDDEKDYQRLLAWFAEGGVRAEVKRVSTYDAALEVLVRNDVTAALVDDRLSGNRGADLARAAAAKGSKVPLILLLDEPNPEREVRGREAGAADCLPQAQVTPLLLERTIRYAVDRVQLLTMVRELTTQDELTGLYTMRELKHLMLEEISRSQRYGRHISLVVVDVDHFDSINVKYGHLVGDQVLQYVAEFLREKVRSLDRVARYGGDQFAILLPETFSSEAFDMTERLRRVATRPFALVTEPGRELALTFSLGVAELPGDAETSEVLIEKALEALQVAKQQGGNCTVQHYTLKGA
jgi:two-component system, cell cycle response regulator